MNKAVQDADISVKKMKKILNILLNIFVSI